MRAVAVTFNFKTGPYFRASHYFRATLASIVLAIALLISTHVRAETPNDTAALRTEFNKIYAQLLHNPSDVDLTLKYADIAVRLGDYEAAIPPLERLVMLDPSLYRTKLKIGSFYAKLGSKVVARSYFEDVAGDARAPKEAVQDAKQYLQNM